MLQPQALSESSARIFSDIKGEILINGEKIKPEFRDILREQSKYLSTSQLFEVFNDTLTAESVELGLNQSKEWDHVLYAKALRYWLDVLNTMVIKLSK